MFGNLWVDKISDLFGGHGAYQAPDWTADRLHREAVYMLDLLAKNHYQLSFDELSNDKQAGLKILLQEDIRKNTYDEETRTITISDLRYQAFLKVNKHYEGLFTDDPAFDYLRDAYSVAPNTLKSQERVDLLNAFFFWATWATITNRPDLDYTYTNNWPPDEMVGNKPTSALILWSGFSVIILLAGIGLLSWFYFSRREEDPSVLPKENPVLGMKMLPSMKATLKYFWMVSLLILVQVLLGVITAQYGVEGQAFYGIPLAEFLPYSLSRTWHVQLAIFWIATSWLATGLFYAPAISGVDPKYQRLGVNVLFGALLIIVVGSLIGQWFGIMQKLGLAENFWFGHQGYEYVDLGRFWQIFLFVGLLIWLFLMVRALLPALRMKTNTRVFVDYVYCFSCGYWFILRRRINVGAANKSGDCRILEMVGSSPLGRRFL